MNSFRGYNGGTKYFPGLQVVRGTAALLVILNHSYAKKNYFDNLPIFQVETVFNNIGVLGLTVFFVLSGFLITLLLLKEKETSGSISLKYFYFRRAVRILPLYYLVILLGHFILPFITDATFEGGDIQNNFLVISLLYLVMLPNYVLIIFAPHNPFVDVTWSIGVEEQFYFLWPSVINKVKNILRFSLVLILIQLTTEICEFYNFFPAHHSQITTLLRRLVLLLLWSKMGYFGMGAIGAYIYFKQIDLRNKMINWLVKFSPLMLTITVLPTIFTKYPIQFLLIGIASLFFLIYLIRYYGESNSLLFRFFEFSGKVSYGLYLWHCFVITFIYKVFSRLNLSGGINNALLSAGLYIIILFITFLLAHYSYKFLEGPFLALKRRYGVR